MEFANWNHKKYTLKIEKHLDSIGPSMRKKKYSCVMLRYAIYAADDCFSGCHCCCCCCCIQHAATREKPIPLKWLWKRSIHIRAVCDGKQIINFNTILISLYLYWRFFFSLFKIHWNFISKRYLCLFTLVFQLNAEKCIIFF